MSQSRLTTSYSRIKLVLLFTYLAHDQSIGSMSIVLATPLACMYTLQAGVDYGEQLQDMKLWDQILDTYCKFQCFHTKIMSSSRELQRVRLCLHAAYATPSPTNMHSGLSLTTQQF